MKTPKSYAAKVEAAMVALRKIHPVLKGIGPDVQSVVLADLTATWLGGFDPADREVVAAKHAALLAELLAAHDAAKAQP